MNPLHPLLAMTGIEPFMIPIFGIVFGCTIAIVAIYTNYRKRKDMFELYHRERMAAIDKGLELPPLPEGFFSDGDRPTPYHPRRNLLKGLVWLFVGLGIFLAFHNMDEPDAAWFGAIPAAVGLAYLIYFGLVGRQEAELADAAEKVRLAETNAARRV